MAEQQYIDPLDNPEEYLQNNPVSISDSNDEAPSGVIDTIVDTAKGVVSAPFKAVENFAQTGRDLLNAADNTFFGNQYIEDDVDYDFVPDAVKPKGFLGKTAQTLTEFAASWVVGGKLLQGAAAATKIPKLVQFAQATSKPAQVTRNILGNGAMAFVTGDNTDKNLANLMVNNDVFGSSFVKFLALDDDDGAIEKRLKNAVESAGVGVALDGVMAVFRGMKDGLKATAKGTAAADIINGQKTAAEKIAAGATEAVVNKTDDAIKNNTDNLATAIKSEADDWFINKVRLTPEALNKNLRELVEEDPDKLINILETRIKEANGILTNAKPSEFNISHFADNAQFFLKIASQDTATVFPKDYPVAMQLLLDSVKFIKNHGLSDKWDIKPLIEGTGDPRTTMALRSHFMNLYVPKHMALVGQKIKDGIPNSVEEAKSMFKDLIQLCYLTKAEGAIAGQTAYAKYAGTIAHAFSGKGYGMNIKLGQDYAEAAANAIANVSDDAIKQTLNTYLEVARANDPKLLERVIAMLTPLGDDLRKQVGLMTKWDIAHEARSTAMLSSMVSFIRNATGNGLMIPLNTLKASTKGAYLGWRENGIVGALSGAKEGVYYLEGLAHALPKALRSFRASWDNIGSAITRPSEYSSLLRHQTGIAALDKARSVYTAPLRLLQATDEFFAALAGGANAYEQTMRGLKASNIYKQATDAVTRRKITEAWVKETWDRFYVDTVTSSLKTVKGLTLASQEQRLVADQATFQQALGGIVQKFYNMVTSSPQLRLIFPFFKTPANIFDTAVGFRNIHFFKNLKNPDPMVAAEAVANLVQTAAIWTTAAALVSEGIITGHPSGSKMERDMKARAGIQPYSIKIDGKYMSLDAMEPFGSILGMMASAKDALERDPNNTSVIDAVWEAFGHAVKDKTFMKGLSDLIESLSDRGTSGARGMFSQIGLSFAPAILRDLGQAVDPIKRQQPDFYSALKDKVGIKDDLAPKIDWLTGQPISYLHGGGYKAFIDAYKISEEEDSIMFNELSRLTDVAPPSDKIGQVKLNPHEYAAFCREMGTIKIFGKTLYETLHDVINHETYRKSQELDPDPTPYELNKIRNKELKKIIDDFRDEAKRSFLAKHPYLTRPKNENIFDTQNKEGTTFDDLAEF